LYFKKLSAENNPLCLACLPTGMNICVILRT